MSRRSLHFAVIAVVVAYVVPSVVRAATYDILDLGTLGGTLTSTQGYGTVNASGQVVGFSYTTGNAAIHAFRTAANSPIIAASDLGTLNGTNSYAYHVTDTGRTVGEFSLTGGGFHAFRTAANGSGTPPTDLGTLPGGTDSRAHGVNASGQAVGTSNVNGTPAYHAFRTIADGTITAASDLGTLGGRDSIAYGINDAGQVVGNSQVTGNVAYRAFRTTATGPITAASDLGTLGGVSSYANAINDSGRVVGYSNTTAGAVHAFRTAANGPITTAGDLGSLGGTDSRAFAVNASGQVVGFSSTNGNAAVHAFFVDVTGPMVDLNALIPANSGWELIRATGINDRGQISGYGAIDGRTHAFLLTPVPEPTCLALTALGPAMLRRRRR